MNKSLIFLIFFSIPIYINLNTGIYDLNIPKIEQVSAIEKRIPPQYRKLIIEQCKKYTIPLKYYIRHIERESNFNIKAINYNYKKGKVISIDEGIAQLNNAYKSDFIWFDNKNKNFDPYNPYEAIPVSCHYLYRLYKVTNNWKEAFAAYNCGLNRMKKGNWPKTTIDHVNYIFMEITYEK